MSRHWTGKVIDLAEGGALDWETLARACLSYMSEADVEDMAAANYLFEHEEEDS